MIEFAKRFKAGWLVLPSFVISVLSFYFKHAVGFIHDFFRNEYIVRKQATPAVLVDQEVSYRLGSIHLEDTIDCTYPKIEMAPYSVTSCNEFLIAVTLSRVGRDFQMNSLP